MKNLQLPDEQRITGYGYWLRRTSLDELPQLFNIVQGHLSLVGPRPLPVEYIALMNERQKRRLQLRPGLTGLVQAGGRNLLTWDRKFELDVEYVEKVGFWFDFIILIKTIPALFKAGRHSHPGAATMPAFEGTLSTE